MRGQGGHRLHEHPEPEQHEGHEQHGRSQTAQGRELGPFAPVRRTPRDRDDAPRAATTSPSASVMAAALAASEATGCRSDRNCVSHASSTRGIARVTLKVAPLDRQPSDERCERKQRTERRRRPLSRAVGRRGPATRRPTPLAEAPEHGRLLTTPQPEQAELHPERRAAHEPAAAGIPARAMQRCGKGDRVGCPDRADHAWSVAMTRPRGTGCWRRRRSSPRRSETRSAGCEPAPRRRPRSRRRAAQAPRWRSPAVRVAAGGVRRHTTKPPAARRASTTITPAWGSTPRRDVTTMVNSTVRSSTSSTAATPSRCPNRCEA